jgi:DNA (cytosine-5)-methyltransferase 1
MRHASLFSGIGGFDLAAAMMGWQNIFYCENDEFCTQILKYHFPKSIAYADIKKTYFARHRKQIDILTGGFPCQPFSDAGLKGGTSDPRYLWPEMYRAIREIRPRWVVAENVRGLISWNAGLVFDTVCTDLENEGYKVWPLLLPACSVNAPHQRYRIWFVAYAGGNGTDISGFGKNGQATGKSEANGEKWKRLRDAFIGNGAEGTTINPDNTGNAALRCGNNGNIEAESLEREFAQFELSRPCDTWITADYASDRLQTGNQIGASTIGWEVVGFDRFPTQSPICSGDDGLSSIMDGITFPKWRRQSIKGFGNAIVPQVAIQIFKTIEAFENESNGSDI